jgi:hypothetical protein
MSQVEVSFMPSDATISPDEAHSIDPSGAGGDSSHDGLGFSDAKGERIQGSGASVSGGGVNTGAEVLFIQSFPIFEVCGDKELGVFGLRTAACKQDVAEAAEM